MSDKDENVVNQDDSASRNGEENFKEEIKDYAKTTMNELLGMFGYDDEITSESVESLDIKVPSTSDEPKVTSAATASQVAMVTAQMPSTPVTMTTVSMATTPPVVIPVSEDSSNDTPIIVKVEGNTSVSDIIRQQNIVAASSKVSSPVSKTPDIPATDPTPVIQSTAPAKSTVTTTSQSTTVQPALAPHFYAVPPAVRGLYCVVANLPLVVNQNKSAMTFKFWNCITCSEYFLQKPEVVFRVQYPHLFNGQPDWLYQAAVCVKCYHNLIRTVEPRTTTIPEDQTKATFHVIDCKLEEKEGRAAGPTVVTPSSVPLNSVIVSNTVIVSTSETKNGVRIEPGKKEDKSSCPVEDSNTDSSVQEEEISEGTESTEESTDNHESYKCYVCSISVSKSSRQGKLRRSKFPSLFVDVPDNVGHFKVCHTCFDRLNRQRDRYVSGNIPDEERDYVAHIKVWTGIDITSKSCSSYSPNICLVCERIVDEIKDPSRPIFRSRYPSLFRNLPDHVIHLPICDKCYKKLQKVKLRYDNDQKDEEERDYIQFINMWRAKKGLGKHAVLV